MEQYKEMRKNKKLSQEQVASAAGMARLDISRFESGRYNPSLELIFGKDLVEAFQKQPIMPYIVEKRLDLARQGVLMPVVHIKDDLEINPREFMVLSYHRVLYSQEVENIDENTTKNIAQQLSKIVQKNYGYILNNDIVRKIVEQKFSSQGRNSLGVFRFYGRKMGVRKCLHKGKKDD